MPVYAIRPRNLKAILSISKMTYCLDSKDIENASVI